MRSRQGLGVAYHPVQVNKLFLSKRQKFVSLRIMRLLPSALFLSAFLLLGQLVFAYTIQIPYGYSDALVVKVSFLVPHFMLRI